MKVKSAEEMRAYAAKVAQGIQAPAILELVGDVGVGKSTFTQGLAEGLGIKEEVTSPSFTLVKEYAGKNCNLAHYDFYRLNDPGILAEDLNEKINDPNTITVIEWGESVANFLPLKHIIVNINYLEDGSREVEIKR